LAGFTKLFGVDRSREDVKEKIAQIAGDLGKRYRERRCAFLDDHRPNDRKIRRGIGTAGRAPGVPTTTIKCSTQSKITVHGPPISQKVFQLIVLSKNGLIRALPRSSPAAAAGHHLSTGSQPDRIPRN
jgi:hypothetical protein